MSWPLPSFSLNTLGNSWLEEYLGPSYKIPDVGGEIRMNSQAIVFDQKVYLIFGSLTTMKLVGPAIDDFLERDSQAKVTPN